MTTDPHALTVVTVASAANDRLTRLLDALEDQTAPRGSFDVVVVDATPDGAFAAAGQDRELAVRVVRADPGASRAEALNVGWRAADTAMIGFLDVDLVPARAWVGAMEMALQRGRRLVTGKFAPDPDTLTNAGVLSHRLWASPRRLQLVSSRNIGCLRRDLEAVGGFDPTVAPTSVDVDLAARLVDSGVDLYGARHVVAYETIDETPLATLAAGRFAHGAEEMETLAEHPRARARLLLGGVFWHRRHAEALLAAAGGLLALRDRRALLLAAPWIHERTCVTPGTGGPRRKWLILPGVFAFDLYDAVVTTSTRLRGPQRR